MVGRNAQSFYDLQFAGDRYASATKHVLYADVHKFAALCGLRGQRVLEVGAGRGLFQNIVEDYVAVDLTMEVRHNFRKPFVQASAAFLPFAADSFDGVFTIWTLEHVPDPEMVLTEFRRVLRPGGYLLLAPAWFTPTWAANGYAARAYRELTLREKLIKASIVWSRPFRLAYVVPRRIWRSICRLASRRPIPFRYRELTPNYERFWQSDSDAVNSMDPFDALQWFDSRGDCILNAPGGLRNLLLRPGPLIIQVMKSAASVERQLRRARSTQ